MGRRRVLVLAAAVAVAVGATAAAVVLPDRRGSAPGPTATALRPVVVEPRPLADQVLFSGRLVPARQSVLTAPFDGPVAALHVRPGDRVEAGAPLLALDTAALLIQMREAEGAWLEAGARVQTLRDWQSAPETLAARRSLAAAEASVEDAARREAQARQLLAAGIIPAEEAHDASRQHAAARRDLEGARQVLDGIRDHASSEALRIATLREENARAILDDLRQRAARATLTAPFAGVVGQVSSQRRDEDGGELGVGTRVTLGDALLTLAAADTFLAVGAVDERDVNALRPGLPVEVRAEAVAAPLSGRIERVASQAIPDAPVPRYETVVAVEGTEALGGVLKIGMTVTLTVTVRQRDAALVVPPSALRLGDGPPTVLVQGPDGGVEERAVTLGLSGPWGAEVTDGLRPGESVLARP